MNILKHIPLSLLCLFLISCSKESAPQQTLAKYVDLDRFMGKWYVHGHSPTFMDRKAFNATETYSLEEEGKIATVYQYRKGSADGKLKTYKPKGTIYDTTTNAEWRMRFFGIINAPYYILYVDADYLYTVVGHPGKEMAWIMSRSPIIEETTYQKLKEELEKRDYELSAFRRIPHE